MRQARLEVLVLFLVAATAVWDGARIIAVHKDSFGADKAGGALVLLGSILACLAVVYLLQTRSPRTEAGLDWRTHEELHRVLIASAILAAYVLLWGYLGYALSTALFLTVGLRVGGSLQWAPILIGSFGTAFGSAYLWASLGMMLPRGFLPWP